MSFPQGRGPPRVPAGGEGCWCMALPPVCGVGWVHAFPGTWDPARLDSSGQCLVQGQELVYGERARGAPHTPSHPWQPVPTATWSSDAEVHVHLCRTPGAPVPALPARRSWPPLGMSTP